MIREAFEKLKNNLELNETFDALIRQRHNAVQSAVQNSGESVSTKLIGSLQRQTKIQPRATDTFDIDILVVLGSFYNWLPFGAAGGIQPHHAMQKMHEIVGDSDRYSAMNPQQDAPTVSFEYHDDVKVELVPAYIDKIGSSPSGTTHSPAGRAYWIVKDGGWVLADYDHEASHISLMNQSADSHLIPTIKMLKAARREHFPLLKPFHLEIVAAALIPAIIAVRKQQGAEISYPVLVTEFFNYAGGYLANPAKIPGSHSPHISMDEATKTTVLNNIEAVKNYCVAIGNLPNDSQKMDAWRILFGEAFPAQV